MGGRRARGRTAPAWGGAPGAGGGVGLALWFAAGVILGGAGAALARQEGAERAPRPARGGPSGAAVPLLSRADGLFQAERFNEALEAYEAAARADALDPRAPHGMAEVYRKLLLDDRAEAAYRRALAIDAGFLPAKLQLAILLHDLGKSEEAVRLLRELERINPSDPQLWGELAINLLRLGEAKEAAALLVRYNEARGPQAWGWARLGQAREELGDLEGAEEAYRRALELDGRSPSAHLWLGRLLMATRREGEARPHLEAFRKLRDLETEAHKLQMALLRAPDDVGALVNLARVRHLLGDAQAALVALRRAREVAPSDPRLVEIERALLERAPPR